MNRHYSSAEYKELCDKLRARFDDTSITTDVMVGFHQESEKDFNDSLEFVKSIAFEKVHVFPYSEREGTLASKKGDDVPKKEKERRASIMIEEANKIRNKYLDNLINKSVEVLFENEIEPNVYQGYTKSYLPVRKESNEKLVGRSIIVKVKKVIDQEVCIAE